MLQFLSTILYIAEIIIGIGFLIFIHEFGHFLMAKKNKVKVEIFSLGFGPALWKKKWGDTEYKIASIPLGGYVKMAGENITEERTGAAYEFQSKTAWQRFQIFVAGALMNLIFTVPLFVVAYLMGVLHPVPVVGVPSPADKEAGIMSSDRILSVDGVKIANLQQYITEIISKPSGAKIKVKVERNGEEKECIVEKKDSSQHRTIPKISVIADIEKNSVANGSGLQRRDKIIFCNDVKIANPFDLDEAIKSNPVKPVKLIIDRNGSQKIITITPTKCYKLPEDKNLLEPIIGSVDESYPAFGKLKEGDSLSKIDGEMIRSWQDIQDNIQKSEKEIEIEFLRGNEKSITKITPIKDKDGKHRIGIGFRNTKILANVLEGSLYYQAGLCSGDEIVSINEKSGEEYISNIFKQQSKQDVKIEVKRNKEKVEITMKGEESLGYGDRIGIALDSEMILQKVSFLEALNLGLKETYGMGYLTLKVLFQLFSFEESPKRTMSGPVGIFQASYVSARLGPGNLFWILGLISVSLGIFNLLPVPVLDGGYLPLLLIEKIRGTAPTERFVIIYQYIGLILLLGLVVFVTFLDIGIIPRA